MPFVAVKSFFLDDPSWPTPPAPVVGVGVNRIQRLQRLQSLGKLAILIEIGHRALEALRWLHLSSSS